MRHRESNNFLAKACKFQGFPDETPSMKKALRFEYGQSDNGQFYWRVKSGNNEILCQGEGYKRRAGVLKVFDLLFRTPFELDPIDLDAAPKAPKKKKRSKPKHYEGKLNRSWP